MRVAASPVGRMEEDVPEASVEDIARPDVATTSQVETAQSKPSSLQVATSMVGQTEEGTPKVSLADVVMG